MIDELSALERIRERFQKISKAVSLGIGDDAAAVRIHPKKLLLATVDSQVEGIHFIKRLISAKHLGRKSIAVSVSDIAAMGGLPKFFLANIGFTRDEDDEFLDDLMDGFQQGSSEFRLELIGGNLSTSDNLFIDITVLGEVEPYLMVKRNGAKPDDIIYVSGTVGDSALGSKILRNGKKSEKDRYLISRHIVPMPRLMLGRELAKKRLATSMIDLSDGLILDLERITVNHGLGAEIYVDDLPISTHYKRRISDFLKNPYELALSGGEDYELLFTSTEEKSSEIKIVSKQLNIKITEIGRVTKKPIVRVLDKYGSEINVGRKGFIHFVYKKPQSAQRILKRN